MKLTRASKIGLASSLGDSIYLDPLFWQALGKARGWRFWKREALCYFDVRLSGRDETSFWESLPDKEE
jgi:hypothetical protein